MKEDSSEVSTLKKDEIIFRSVSIEDSGTYTISCENDVGKGSAKFVIVVTSAEEG